MDPSADIILIHGLWMTPRSWEHWAERYESRGHTVAAPAWPGLSGEVEALRADPTPLTKLDINQIVDHYEHLIGGLDSQPVIIGHSIGGTIAQLLADRGLGRAAVGIAPAAPKGVRDLPLSTLRSSNPVLGKPFNRSKATGLSPKQFHYAFANTLSREESDRIYERYHVPAANRVLFELAFANLHRNAPTTVDFANEARTPMLFVAFSEDHVVPPKPIRHNVDKHSGTPIAAYKEFEGRPHFPGVPGWEEVADYALAWALDPQPTGVDPASAQAGPSSNGAANRSVEPSSVVG